MWVACVAVCCAGLRRSKSSFRDTTSLKMVIETKNQTERRMITAMAKQNRTLIIAEYNYNYNRKAIKWH